MNDSRVPATVFAWLLGQDDNIGDTVLRREYANALRRRGPLVVQVGVASEGYISGLGLQPGERTQSSFRAWISEIRAAVKRGEKVTVAINSGEFALSRLYALLSIQLLPTLRLVRRSGGTVVWLGAAVPWRGRRWLDGVFGRLFDSAQLVRWRDNASSEVFRPAPWMPDWAFAAGSGTGTAERRSLGVSLRFDRPYPTDAWLAAVRALAARLDLSVVAVAQVQRDTDYANRLAAELGGSAVEFSSGGHAEQEALVREVYSTMSVMLSDRLHGLIMAATEGVVPLAWCEAATEKIGRHLDPVGLGFATSADPIAAIEALDAASVAEYARLTAASVTAAAADLAAVRDELAALP